MLPIPLSDAGIPGSQSGIGIIVAGTPDFLADPSAPFEAVRATLWHHGRR